MAGAQQRCLEKRWMAPEVPGTLVIPMCARREPGQTRFPPKAVSVAIPGRVMSGLAASLDPPKRGQPCVYPFFPYSYRLTSSYAFGSFTNSALVDVPLFHLGQCPHWEV